MRSMVLLAAPQCHIHYLIDDELADIQGYSEIEIVCHACGLYDVVLFNLPAKDDPIWDTVDASNGLPILAKVREEFIEKHKNCKPGVKHLLSELLGNGNEQFKFLCPDWRKFGHPESTIDLRTNKPETMHI